MPASRLLLAAQSGELELPKGCIGWLNAPGDGEIGVAAGDIRAAQPFYPDHLRLQGRGISVTPTLEKPVDHALVSAHRSKAATLELIARAADMTPAGSMIAVDGDKTDGIESILKELKRRFDGVESYSKAHGKLIWLTRPTTLPDLSDWQDVTYLFPNGWATRAGVFSADGPDAGSKALAAALPAFKGRVADLGSGWGYLSGEALKSDAVTELHGIEADYHAVQCARHNVQDARASFHWDDALRQTHKGFDTVICNPPFHTTRKPDPALGVAFIQKAAEMLKPKGSLWLVANRNLPYEATLEDRFRRADIVTQDGGFKVIHAQAPKNARAT